MLYKYIDNFVNRDFHLSIMALRVDCNKVNFRIEISFALNSFHFVILQKINTFRKKTYFKFLFFFNFILFSLYGLSFFKNVFFYILALIVFFFKFYFMGSLTAYVCRYIRFFITIYATGTLPPNILLLHLFV